MEYYERLRSLREDKDYTQAQIASVLQTTQSYYAKYENGKHELPLKQLRKICLLYGVSADYILGLPRGMSWPR